MRNTEWNKNSEKVGGKTYDGYGKNHCENQKGAGAFKK